jgi:hypothetical protein
MLDSPREHFLNDDWLTEEELKIKRRHRNRDERSREFIQQIYGAPYVLHPARASSATGPS